MENFIDVEGIKVPIGSHENRTIVIGSDHRGYKCKVSIIDFLTGKGYEIIDVGTDSIVRCDYPIFSDEIGKKVSEDYLNRAGIAICGSGIGILVCAGKHKRIVPARCLSSQDAETSRKHNNSNAIGISADGSNPETILETIKSWLRTPFYSDSSTEKDYLRRYVQMARLEDGIR